MTDFAAGIILVSGDDFQHLEVYATLKGMDVETVDVFQMPGYGFYKMDELEQMVSHLMEVGTHYIMYRLSNQPSEQPELELEADPEAEPEQENEAQGEIEEETENREKEVTGR